MKQNRVAIMLVAVWLVAAVLMSLVMACAKPAPTPAPSPKPVPPAPAPAPSPAPAPAPSPKPAPPPSPSPTLATKTFTYNAYEPNAQVYEYKWQVWYTNEITKRTNGLMKFDLRYAAAFGYPIDKFVPVTGQGLVNFSNTMDSNESGNMPEFIIGPQPMLFDDFNQFEKFRQKAESELAKYLLEKWKVVLLANAPMADQSLMMTKPVKSLADLKGKKIRVLSEAEGAWVKAVGATPVTIMFPELYSSFERGVIDGMVFYHMGLLDMKFYEVTKYVPIRNVRSNWDLVVVNKDLWDSLPKEWKDVINGLKEEYVQYALKDLATLYEGSRKQLEQQGVDFTALPAADMQKARELAVPVWESYAQKYGATPQKLLKVAREITGR